MSETESTLELADELMALAPTISSPSANGATLIREAAARLRLLHFASPAVPEMVEALQSLDEDKRLALGGTHRKRIAAVLAKAKGKNHDHRL